MKVLLIHNYYRSGIPSGENAVVDSEIGMLRAHGHEVEVFSRCNDSIRAVPVLGAAWSMISMIANPFALVALRRRVSEFKPDIVHVHNLFPLISPLALLAVGRIPCVMTLHNYRLFCAGETVCRGGRPCTICLEARSVRGALRHKCYRNSCLATIPLAVSIALYRALGFWRRRISRFVALTEFQREMVVKAGLAAEKVIVKPNHYLCRGETVVPWNERADRVVFIGRVSPEKGCGVLIDAWNRLGSDAPELVVLGDGTDLESCKCACRSSQVEFKGAVDHDMVLNMVAGSKLLIVPSLCYEGLPTTILEAFSTGTPVLVSDLGAMPAMAGDAGRVFEAGSSESLVAAFKEIWKDDANLGQMGIKARERYLQSYTAEVNYRNQLDLYNKVLKEAYK